MLKAEVTKESTSVEIIGSLPDICSDLTHIIRGIIEKLEESDAEVALQFKVMFASGFVSGVVFGEDKEHMNHYIELGKGSAEVANKHVETAKQIAKQIEQLKQIRDILKSMQEESEKDEAE